ncbi:MOP flippase family protein [Labilibaculum antarcticum]|uniref:Lipopolysaccharide biosynthesis protein n=1 Tax=Labilibaculum antarcticum TaxID=1717717 RepID=A0A1Y1CF26_9BACT|nr:MOP flippase family protein [Labilibaculum antarcticum]BAX78642.1 lipopolysaccharide biosynthesis protein [Labilibaculum antarcticum]
MNLKKKSIDGAKWTTFSTVVVALSAIIKASILTRIIEVSDFGLMALVTFILGFIIIFIDLGLTTAILHRQKITKNEYSSLFWLNLGFSIFLFFILFLVTSFISEFYKESELMTLIPLASIGLIVNAMGCQFRTVEQKELNFKLLALVDIFSSVVSLGVAVILAINDFGVYSLVYSSLAYTTLVSFFYFIKGLIAKRLKFHFMFSDAKPFLKIGVFNIGGQVINYFIKEVDILIVGNVFGTEVLGGYSLAKQLVDRPLRVIRPVVLKVMAPILSLIQGDKISLRENYLKIIKFVSSISIPIYLLFILFAKPIVLLFYGAGYQEIEILVRILSIYMFFISIKIPSGSLIIATGKTNLEFYWFLASFIIMPIGILIGSKFSIEAVASAMVIVMVIYFIPMWKFLINPLIKVEFSDYYKAHIPSLKLLKQVFIKKND